MFGTIGQFMSRFKDLVFIQAGLDGDYYFTRDGFLRDNYGEAKIYDCDEIDLDKFKDEMRKLHPDWTEEFIKTIHFQWIIDEVEYWKD